MSLASTDSPTPKTPLAVVGIGCRFPGGVVDVASFWELLIEGRSGIVEVPEDRWNRDRYYHPDRSVPGRMVTQWGGFVDHLDRFDPQFWGISPREAVRMDPQQRWLLEVSWEAIEDAGISPSALRGRSVGVFVGIAGNDYAGLQMPNHAGMDVHTNSGCTLSIASNRISYLLDLKGPSMSVDTACSSALVAMSQACQSIWAGDCDAALTGGVNAIITPHATIGFSKASMLSPDGQCFAFDQRANGYVRGEGAAMVLIKRLDDAIKAGDPIYAVIRAAVVNQDGHTSSMTVPGVEGQSAMLRRAYRDAGLPPSSVVYMEAHGTGTPVGDPIEATALGEVLRQGRAADSRCLIGSVKTNLGHLESGSGIAGFIKAALVLHHDQVPKNLNFETPNPVIPLEQLGLEVADRPRPLPHQGSRRPVVGVNSFGFGGTNAHVVLEAAPDDHDCQAANETADAREDRGARLRIPRNPSHNGHPSKDARADRPHLLAISARDETSLRSYVQQFDRLLARIDAESDSDERQPSKVPLLEDICYSAGARKEHHADRLVLLGSDAAEIRARMASWLADEPSEGVIEGKSSGSAGDIVFVFTGQGAQWWRMGRDLYAAEPVFRRCVDDIDQRLRPLAGWSLIDEMIRTQHESQSKIDQTNVAQPAIFALQVALAALWDSWGIRPARVIGHSVGEVAAAYVAGIYSLDDAVKIIYHRSRLQNSAGGDGRMLAVGISAAEARQAIGDRGDQMQVAVINSPTMVTIAGDREPIEQLEARLKEEGTFVRQLRINYAFHTHHMDPLRDELIECLADIRPRRGRIPMVSTVTGGVLSGDQLDAVYWWRNVRQPVLFASGIANLVRAGERVFLELGPHPALESSINEGLAEQNRTGDVFHSLRRKEDESTQILANLAALHSRGASIDWQAVTQSAGRFVRLPKYPWHHESYWLETESSRRERLDPIAHPMLGQRQMSQRPEWQFDLDPRLFSYLADHCIWDSIILPGAAYGEIGLAIARELFPDRPYVIEDLEILKALFVSEDRVPVVRVSFEASDHSYTVHSSSGGHDWELNARGRLVELEATDWPLPDLVALRQQLPERLSHQEYYDDFDAAGFQFRENFRQIQNVWRKPGEVVAEIVVPPDVAETSGSYRIHPAVLDACFHVFRGVKIVDNPRKNFFLPAHVRRIRLYRDQPPGRLWAHGKMIADDGDSMTTDIWVYDTQGNRVADILGFRVDRVQQNEAESVDDLFFQHQWQACPLELGDRDTGVQTDEDVSPGFILLADTGDLCDRIAKELTDDGAAAIVVTKGSQFRRTDDDRFEVGPTSDDDLKRVFTEVRSGGSRIAGIVHAWSLDQPRAAGLSTEQLGRSQQDGVLSSLRLAHAIAAMDGWQPRVHFITRDAQAVVEGDRVTGLASSPIIGFARVAANEHASLRWTVIDLENQSDADEASAIARELLGGDEELEVAYRAGQRWANRLVQVNCDQLPGRTLDAVGSSGDVVPYRLESTKPGILTNLVWNETQRRAPAGGEIEVRIGAGGINFRDVMKALAMYPGNPIDLLWFGDDFAGTVVAVGDGVSDLKVGDQVAGMAPYSFRAYSTIDRRMAFKKPSRLSLEQASTLPTVFLTSHYALNHLARIAAGEKILIHAGTGGVGQAAIQIAQHRGLEIFATAGSEEKRQMLRQMGVPHVMNSRTLDFADEIMRITDGAGVDVVLNSLAGEFIPKNFSVLAPFGRFLEIGKIDVYGNSRIGLHPLRNNISYFVIDLAQHLEQKTDFVAQMFDELLPRFEAGDYRPLTHTTFPITEVVDAFRYMAQGKHVGKNVLTFDVDQLKIGPSTDDDQIFRSDASYLIVGGAAGFSLQVARWMTRHGAKHLVLMSRSGPPDAQAEAAIQAMIDDGVAVLDARGDVTISEDVRRVIETASQQMPPLAGVIHGAMVLDDRFIADLDQASFSKVMDPKVLGAWNLHLATRDLPLDHFICFSSFSNIIGGAKQSNYNAGNLFLDALAHHRRGSGLPALTINWSALSGAGFVERNEMTAKYLDKLGMKSLSLSEAFDVLRRMLSRDPVQVAACRADWQALARLSPLVATSNTFQAMIQSQRGVDSGGSLRPRLLAAMPEQRVALLTEFVTQQVADVFGVDPARIDPDASLTHLGLDSLMAIDLINRIESELSASLPMGSVLRGPSLKELAEILVALVGDATNPAGDEGRETALTSGAPVPLERSLTRQDEFPLSAGQQSLWFLYRLAPTSSAYNLTFAAKFTPHVDLELMEQAFVRVLSQHPMLNVTFSDSGGLPVQRLTRGGELDYREHDASDLSKTDLDDRLMQCACEPFDLENGPVIRLDMFRLADGHLALMSMHHIVSDAWSVTVLIRDLLESYFTLRAGRVPQLPDQQYGFDDFVDWEQRHLASEAGRKMGQYWQRHIVDAPKTIELPTDHPRPSLPSFRGGTHGFKLDAEISHRAIRLAAEQNVTLFTLLLSVYEVLLHHYSGQDDFLVGVPMAGRQHEPLQNTVGYFVNPVPLRSCVSDDPTFIEFLTRNHDNVAAGLVNQQYPLRHLVRDLQLPRDSSRSPLFQVAFSMERIPGFDEEGIAIFLIGEGGHKFHLGDLEMESVDLNLRQAQFEILLVVEEAGGNIFGCWQYSRDLFEPETINRLNSSFVELLDSVLGDPTRPVSKYSLTSMGVPVGGPGEDSAERDLRRQIAVWNATDTEDSCDLLVHQKFERHVHRAPHRVAVSCGEQQLTYSELNERSNQLARHLRSLGVARDQRVGVCMNRDVDLLVSLLAVMKAGGAYVPLDPTYPQHRLQTIAQSAGMSWVLTHDAHRDRVLGCGRIVAVDSDRQAIATYDPSNLDLRVGPNDLMYVIYTSGSTGQPKGAAVYHRGFGNLLDWFVREFELESDDSSLVVTSHGFDLTQKNLFALLTVGGQVHFSADTRFDADRVLAEIDGLRITRLNCTPSNFYLLVVDRDPEELMRLDSLRTVWLGGERIDMSRLTAWRERDGFDTELVNTYGPTECTDICSYYRVPPQSHEQEIPVGFPISNVQTYVLDDSLSPIGIGKTGEICIAGAGVGAGYINDPELTAQKFASNPFSPTGGDLIYRTGDLGRYRGDGAIEFVGRSDDQVKIRGHRIELGEIENTLRQHPDVQDAVVIAHQSPSGATQLIAYYLCGSGEIVVSDLKSYLGQRLAAPMVPSHFMKVEQIPLNPHGKVDRRALPKPDLDLDQTDRAGFVAPRDATEESLVELWQDVLGIRGIGVRDSFFELGGDSMQSVQLMIKVRREFGVEIPLAALVQGDTIAQMASHLRQRHSSQWSPLVTIQPHGDRPPLFCVHPVGGNVLCYSQLASAVGDLQPIYGIQARGVDGEDEPTDSIETMVEEYLEAVRSVQPEGPYCFVAWSSGGVVAYEMARRLRAQGQPIGLLALLDSYAPSLLDFDASDEAAVLIELIGFLDRFYGLKIEISYDELASRDSAERLPWLHQRMQDAGFVPADVDQESIGRFLNVCKANLRALQDYDAEACELNAVLFKAEDPSGRSHSIGDASRTDLGWLPILGDAIEIVEVSGNHVTMLTGDHVKRLGEQLRKRIENCTSARPVAASQSPAGHS